MVTRITPLPTPVPQTSDPANFNPRADALLTTMPQTVDDINVAIVEIDEAVDTAQSAAQVSLSHAGFVGEWSDLSGPLTVPATVFHGGLFWVLLRDIADVTASQPDPFNTDWAVGGAPAWYNNFAVGDFLDTARTPGAGWLRRNGAAYPRSTYPELAPLMPTIPASFSFTPVSVGIAGDISNIVEFAGALVLWPENGNSVYVSEDVGETWEAVQVVPSARRFCTGCVFQGKLLIGLDNGAYVQCDDLETFAVKSVTGFTNQDVHLAASATAVVAAGQNPSSPSGTQILRRSTNLSTWTAPSMSGALPYIQGMTHAGDLFLTVDGRTGGTTAALSIDDGASFIRLDGAAAGANPATLGNASRGLKGANDEVFGIGSHWRTPLPGSQSFPILLSVEEATGNVLNDPDLNFIGAGLGSFEVVIVEDKYLLFASTPTGGSGRAAYSFDKSSWVVFNLPAGHAVRSAIVSGSWVVAVGWNGSVMRGRFIDSDAFRVPDDNPTSGWIKAVSDSAGTVGYAGVPEAPLTGGPFGREGGAWVGLGGGGSIPPAGIAVSTGTEWGASKAAPAGAVVGTSDTQTLTNKTLGAGSKESVTIGSTITINAASAPFQQITLGANATATVNLAVGESRTIWINPGVYTVSWPAGIWWPGGSAPSLPASKWSEITFNGRPDGAVGAGALVVSQP